MSMRMTGAALGSILALCIAGVVLIFTGCSSPGPLSVQAERIPPSPTSGAPATGTPKASSAAPSSVSPVRSSNAGAVTIDARWRIEGGISLVFDITMDTHSVDLDGYDLKKLAVLRDDRGNQYQPTSWIAPPGGHHRSGKLTFAVPDILSQGKVKSLELIIRDVAGVKEMVLVWDPV